MKTSKKTEKSMEKATNRIIRKIEQQMKQENKLISNYKYIKWLEIFTLSHPNFADDTWLYSKDEISQEDYINVCKLTSFFSAIQRYCSQFNIDTSGTEAFEASCIHIKYNGIGYAIGLMVGQGSFSYITREEVLKNSIDFKAIVKKIPPYQQEIVDILLKRISWISKEDIPLDELIETVKKYYN